MDCIEPILPSMSAEASVYGLLLGSHLTNESALVFMSSMCIKRSSLTNVARFLPRSCCVPSRVFIFCSVASENVRTITVLSCHYTLFPCILSSMSSLSVINTKIPKLIPFAYTQLLSFSSKKFLISLLKLFADS